MFTIYLNKVWITCIFSPSGRKDTNDYNCAKKMFFIFSPKIINLFYILAPMLSFDELENEMIRLSDHELITMFRSIDLLKREEKCKGHSVVMFENGL